MSAFEELEQLLLTLRTCFVYKLPRLSSATAGQQAGGWDLANPILTAELRVYQKNQVCFVRLYERKGIQERLFAQAKMDLETGKPVQAWLEPVTDSSRYFVLRCEDEDTGRKASVGIGFAQREESFSFKAAIQDFEGFCRRQNELERRQAAMAAKHEFHGEAGDKATDEEGEPEVDLLTDPTLDFSFHEGQKIHVNFAGQLGSALQATAAAPKPKSRQFTGKINALAPPPAAGARYAPSSSKAAPRGDATEPAAAAAAAAAATLPAFGTEQPSHVPTVSDVSQTLQGLDVADEDDGWGDFVTG